MKSSKGLTKYYVALLITASLGLMLGTTAIAHEHSVAGKVMSVTGSASTSFTPDLVTVRFGIETQRKSSRAALSVNAELMQSVIDSLAVAGINQDEISTIRFNIRAIYDNQKDRDTGRRSQVLAGYRVSNILMVETGQLDLIATILDTAVSAGVNRIETVEFSISQTVLADLKDGLIELAVLNARAKAELALSPLDHMITGVKSIFLNDFTQPIPMYPHADRLEMSMSVPTQIFAKDQEVRTTVSVTFLIGETVQK